LIFVVEEINSKISHKVPTTNTKTKLQKRFGILKSPFLKRDSKNKPEIGSIVFLPVL
jgi:hypothetical protein